MAWHLIKSAEIRDKGRENEANRRY